MISNSSTRVNAVVRKKDTRPSATLHLLQSSRFAKRLAKLLVIGLFVSVLGMALLPWQQTSRGTGSVVAFVPQERQQSIESPVKGVIARIGDGLYEGVTVEEGDFILEIQPIAANMRLQLEGQLKELETKVETAEFKARLYQDNIQGYTEAKESTIANGEQMVQAAEAKLEGKKKLITAYEAKELQARLNFQRQTALEEKGLTPVKEIEKLKKEWDVTKAELSSLFQEVEALKKEVKAKEAKLAEQTQLAQIKIDTARGMRQDAVGNAASTRKDIGDLRIKLEEMERLTIRATRSGTIFRMPYQIGESVKAGDKLLTIVPEVTQQAVELMVNGNDMPLVQPGQEVRLQFEGWPAVQFAGWPSISVGTFSGEVATVDATDNGSGMFRIMVLPVSNPDPNDKSHKWPSERYLRQGVRTNGWVMLKQVPLGWELWRQLNGFPVALADEEPKKEKVKTPKLPK